MHDVASAPVAASWRRHNRHVNDVACGCARMLTLIQYSTKYKIGSRSVMRWVRGRPLT